MDNIVYGFVSELHGNNWLCVPATKDLDTGEITCHDVSGFGGSWSMHQGGVFFEQEGGGCFCNIALNKAETYSNSRNFEGE